MIKGFDEYFIFLRIYKKKVTNSFSLSENEQRRFEQILSTKTGLILRDEETVERVAEYLDNYFSEYAEQIDSIEKAISVTESYLHLEKIYPKPKEWNQMFGTIRLRDYINQNNKKEQFRKRLEYLLN